MNRPNNESTELWIDRATNRSSNELTEQWIVQVMNRRAMNRPSYESTELWFERVMNRLNNESTEQWIDRTMNRPSRPSYKPTELWINRAMNRPSNESTEQGFGGVMNRPSYESTDYGTELDKEIYKELCLGWGIASCLLLTLPALVFSPRHTFFLDQSCISSPSSSPHLTILIPRLFPAIFNSGQRKLRLHIISTMLFKLNKKRWLVCPLFLKVSLTPQRSCLNAVKTSSLFKE